MLKIALLGWIAGIAFMGLDLPFVATTWWMWLVLAIAVFAYGFYDKRLYSNNPIYKALILISVSWALFCTGFHYADTALEQRLKLREVETQPFEAIVYIKKIDELSDAGQKQIAEVLNRHTPPVNWVFYERKTQVELGQPAERLRLGHYYRIDGAIKPAHSYAVAGVFDQEKWFLQQNVMSAFSVRHIQPLSRDEIYRLGYQQHLKQQQRLQARFLLKIETMRLSFRNMFQTSEFQHKGLLLALLTGDESLLSNRLKQQFQQLGISHLLAISGPHVLIFALLLTWLLKSILQRYCPKLYLWQPRQILLLFPFVLSVLLYVVFVGFEIPAIRTLLTVIIASLFLLFRQSILPLSLLVYSASLLLIYDPFSILSAAFWLSYGACFILLRIYQTLAQLPKDHVLTAAQQMIFGAKILIESQWKIFVALLPLILIFFQQVSWLAPLGNLIAIPLLSGVIVPLNIIAACVWLIIPVCGQVLFQFNDRLLSVLMWMLNSLKPISPDLYGVSFTPVMILSLILGLIILFMPRGTIPKMWAGICLLPIVLGVKTQPTILNILDVGQGQSIFLQHPQQTLMFDTGGSYDEAKFNLGERVVIPFLRQQGIRTLDHVILSHLDQDHSGAFPSIQNAFDITQVQSNERSDTVPFKDNFSLCQQGQNWSYSNLKIQILSPDLDGLALTKHQKNEQSCVVYLQFLNAQPYQNFLIMGDAGWETEYKLLQQYPDLKVDVLVLGHHGSKNSSAYDFLAVLKPKLAIASAGFENRYGHPSQELQSRLRALNIPLLNTAQTGSLSFVFEHDTVALKQHRQQLKWLRRE
ncbi:DNA internalization-related competence protein ComEC/Rec2 [Acinetobacter sp. C26M]|uniref:DNA internalization-related competence protein ComEC/Rec2 n=1 Tax=unclassified Acinetobacter TaxID=196816 RepID=UPI00203761F8|nr:MULTISPECIES: DNA internalization-related competence protein ComEC/Rec2 [unclassified Acinetobacter]USA47651.1 DNA internalization-related competence protein ComEC/Rec2 [Acinetobacter sp. C26M]USA51132.1 DNA internalization-related competence protein ComEC/Rec2 [Acinetobacter sp. C26G]